jgi:hypothetical protein
MNAIFYALFDETSELSEACLMHVCAGDVGVARFLQPVLGAVDIKSELLGTDGTLKVHAHDLIATQTLIMKYFAKQATKVPTVAFRLPGIHWQPPPHKREADFTVRELMFARTYGRDIAAARLPRIIEEAEIYDDDFPRIVCK